jgi:starch-binding outer membrane protein, SusD/RagB family
MFRRRTHFATCLASVWLLVIPGCDLDINNPNAPTDEQVLSTPEGLKALAIGVQARIGSSIEEAVVISGLISGEMGTTPSAVSPPREFQSYPDETANTDIEDTNPVLASFWTKHYGVVKSANDILLNAEAVTLDPGTRSGMIALAKLAKAMAFGTLIENFEQIPLTTAEASTPSFADRAAVLNEVRALLNAARSELSATPPSAEFSTTIVATGFDLSATISAMQARYSLLAGAFQEAIDFAAEVPPVAQSVLTYSPIVPNPLKSVIIDLNYYRPLSSFRADAEEGDERVNRFTTAEEIPGFGGATLNGINVFLDSNDPIPVFSRDEILLIQAEAYARLTNLPAAIEKIDSVRARAGLGLTNATTQSEVLEEILRQRRYSLFLTGLRWGDLRRFERSDQATVAWLPYPFAERVTNPNTPPNP